MEPLVLFKGGCVWRRHVGFFTSSSRAAYAPFSSVTPPFASGHFYCACVGSDWNAFQRGWECGCDFARTGKEGREREKGEGSFHLTL